MLDNCQISLGLEQFHCGSDPTPQTLLMRELHSAYKYVLIIFRNLLGVVPTFSYEYSLLRLVLGTIFSPHF